MIRKPEQWKWQLASAIDPRWNAAGEGISMYAALVAKSAKEREFGEPPADLRVQCFAARSG